MELFKLTRELIDIESISGNEGDVGKYLEDHLSRAGFDVELQGVADNRFNVVAKVGEPRVTLSTHIDTVPPFIASREDDRAIFGRGGCDAKGLVAAQIEAAKKLRADKIEGFGLLSCGEEAEVKGQRVANTLQTRTGS
jgi:acetylornithine deacetylase